MIVFWLAIFGMICWGIAPLFAKIGLHNVDPTAALAVRTLMAATLISGWLGFSGHFDHVRAIPLNSWLLIGIEAILATLVGDLAYYAAIKRGEVSIVTVIMASSPLVTMAGAVWFLGEDLNFYKIIGASFIILGIILIM